MEPTKLLDKARIFNIVVNDSLLYLYKIEKNLKKYNTEDGEKLKEIIEDLMKISKKIAELNYNSKGNCEIDRNYSKLLLQNNSIELWK